MYCQNCGSKIDEDVKFCPKCGEEIYHKQESAFSQDSIRSDEDSNTELSPFKSWISKIGPKKAVIVIAVIVVIAVAGVILRSIGGIIGESSITSYQKASDLEILATMVQGENGYFMVKNTGNQVITDFTLTVAGFDASGNVIDLTGSTVYQSFDFATTNILPDTVFGLKNYVYLRQDVKYMEAMVSSITYKDGSVWSTKGLDAWTKDVSDDFSVEEYRHSIDAMKSDAILAESNEYLKITGSSKYSDNQFSNDDDFDFSAENIGDRDIQKFDIIVMEYDANGYGISVSPYEFVMQNCRVVSADPANLMANCEATYNKSLFFESECKTYNTLVYEIEFKDGTKWTNEYAFQWMLYNKDKR